MNGSIDVIIRATPEMIHNWGWLLAFGVVLIVLGVVAVVRAATATIASMMFFGWLWYLRVLSSLSKRSWLGTGRASFCTC